MSRMRTNHNIVRQGSVMNPSRLSTYNNTDGVAPCETPLGTNRDLKFVKTYQTVNRLNVLVNFAKD